jgi:hypothetical protein
VTVIGNGELHQRYVVACALPASELMKQAPHLRGLLNETAKALAQVLKPMPTSAAAA